jgi:hypothetical protein
MAISDRTDFRLIVESDQINMVFNDLNEGDQPTSTAFSLAFAHYREPDFVAILEHFGPELRIVLKLFPQFVYIFPERWVFSKKSFEFFLKM